jgi:peptide/nickel transport system permease protein
MPRSLISALGRLALLLVAASLLGAVFVRVAPGFSVDEREITPGLSSESISALHRERMEDANLFRFYLRYLTGLAHGDLGTSRALNQPVRELLRDRIPVSARNLAAGLLVAWSFGLALSFGGFLARAKWLGAAGDACGGAMISTPASVLALAFVMLRWPAFLAVGLLVFPKIYRYTRNLLQDSKDLPHVFTARAKGAGSWRVLTWHVAPVASPQLIALLGVSISVGFGVLLPVEVISDTQGIGLLAWSAAQSRDLPLLVNLTLIVSLVTIGSTVLCDEVRRCLTRGGA